MTLFKKPKRFWWDVAERVGMTFVAAFVMFWITGTDLDEAVLSGDWQTTVSRVGDMALYQKAVLAGVVAVGTVVKTLVGGIVGNHGTASVLPQEKDPATSPPVPPQ